MLPAGFPSHVLRLLAFFLLPDGFFTPTAAKETPSTAVLRATAAGWSYSLSSPLPPQLATLQERHWRALLREVHRLDCGLVLAPWLDLFVHLLFVLALGLIVVWKPLLKELEMMPFYLIIVIFVSMLLCRLMLQNKRRAVNNMLESVVLSMRPTFAPYGISICLVSMSKFRSGGLSWITLCTSASQLDATEEGNDPMALRGLTPWPAGVQPSSVVVVPIAECVDSPPPSANIREGTSVKEAPTLPRCSRCAAGQPVVQRLSCWLARVDPHQPSGNASSSFKRGRRSPPPTPSAPVATYRQYDTACEAHEAVPVGVPVHNACRARVLEAEDAMLTSPDTSEEGHLGESPPLVCRSCIGAQRHSHRSQPPVTPLVIARVVSALASPGAAAFGARAASTTDGVHGDDARIPEIPPVAVTAQDRGAAVSHPGAEAPTYASR